MMKIFRVTGFVTLLLIGFGDSSFAGLQELFDFEDKMRLSRWVTRGTSSLSADQEPTADQKQLRKDAILSIIRTMPPKDGDIFADQILALERHEYFYLDVEEVTLFAQKSSQDRDNIVKHIEKTLANYTHHSVHDEFSLNVCASEGWKRLLRPLLDPRQVEHTGPGAECLNKIFASRNMYSQSLLMALERIHPTQQEDVVRQVFRLKPTSQDLDFGPYLMNFRPFVEILEPLSPAERDDIIMHTHKISSRDEGGEDIPHNLAIDLTVLTFLSKVEPSERSSLVEVLVPLCRYNYQNVGHRLTLSNDMFYEIFNGIHSKSIGAFCLQGSLHWDNEELLQETVRQSKSFLLELRSLNWTTFGKCKLNDKAKMISSIKYASVSEREGSQQEIKAHYSSLSATDRRIEYSHTVRAEQITIFNRISEVLPSNFEEISSLMEILRNKSRQNQNQILDHFLSSRTHD